MTWVRYTFCGLCFLVYLLYFFWCLNNWSQDASSSFLSLCVHLKCLLFPVGYKSLFRHFINIYFRTRKFIMKKSYRLLFPLFLKNTWLERVLTWWALSLVFPVAACRQWVPCRDCSHAPVSSHSVREHLAHVCRKRTR